MQTAEGRERRRHADTKRENLVVSHISRLPANPVRRERGTSLFFFTTCRFPRNGGANLPNTA